jgi:ankyrin repeat protein
MNLPSKTNVSVNGRALLEELSHPSSCSLSRCLELIAADPLAGRLKNTDGETAFHLLTGLAHKPEIVITLLSSLLGTSAAGAKVLSSSGRLPLHLLLAQSPINYPAAHLLLEAYPGAASSVDGDGYLPLFLLCMHEDPSPACAHLCRALCRAFPDGPAARNKTGSHPLHFAAKRQQPNKEVLRILLRRYPEAAGWQNRFMMFPLHCAVSSTGDVEAVRLIYEACPAAAAESDEKGRNVLHLALLRIGSSDLALRRAEEAEREVCSALDAISLEEAGCAEDEDEERQQQGSVYMRERNVGRTVLYFLVSMHPLAMVTANNFFTMPVDTALAEVRPEVRRHKRVSVFGLHDDPLSARILLCAHARHARSGLLPMLRLHHLKALRNLNWEARRGALLASLVGTDRGYRKKVTATKREKDHKDETTIYRAPLVINPNNILARLRHFGGVDCLQLCISWL